jgi:hypothetical protein
MKRRGSTEASSSFSCDTYLADGQKDLARQHAEKAIALLDSHAAPASSWSDTEPQRGEIVATRRRYSSS